MESEGGGLAGSDEGRMRARLPSPAQAAGELRQGERDQTFDGPP